MPGYEEVIADRWTHAFVVEDGPERAAGFGVGSGEGACPMLLGIGPIAHDAIAPLVEHETPRVSITRGLKAADFERPGIKDVAARRVPVAERSPGRFQGCRKRHAFQHVQESAVGPFPGAHRVVGVIGGNAVDQLGHFIGFIVAVGLRHRMLDIGGG